MPWAELDPTMCLQPLPRMQLSEVEVPLEMSVLGTLGLGEPGLMAHTELVAQALSDGN